ncbi:MAG: DUF368 domain-containing protein [Treponema sp.]|nr:DUF368 domain-containing protein [Treponema sp.]
MEILRLILIGIVIGMANVIPGVSGGTLAVVFNIYDKFINAITLNVKRIIANRKFVFPLLIGMAIGVLLFSKLITVLYGRFPIQTNFFFTGLILGSMPLIFKFMLKTETEEKLSVAKKIIIFVCVLAGLVALLFFSSLESNVDKSQMISVLPPISVGLSAKIFFAGLIGAIAMIIPGISGSLLMLILGVYPIVMSSIPALFDSETMFHAFFLLLPNGIGVLLGLLIGAQIVKVLLRIAPNHTYAVIFGLLCGSAITLIPDFSVINGFLIGITSFISLVSGMAMAYFSAKLAPEE